MNDPSVVMMKSRSLLIVKGFSEALQQERVACLLQ
jgi:hypothetical protein